MAKKATKKKTAGKKSNRADRIKTRIARLEERNKTAAAKIDARKERIKVLTKKLTSLK